jgi:hypothetical protein
MCAIHTAPERTNQACIPDLQATASIVRRVGDSRQHRQYFDARRTIVIVNGTIVVDNAAHTGALARKVLRRDRDGSVG